MFGFDFFKDNWCCWAGKIGRIKVRGSWNSLLHEYLSGLGDGKEEVDWRGI